jgi:hypothetical protein
MQRRMLLHELVVRKRVEHPQRPLAGCGELGGDPLLQLDSLQHGREV